MCLLKVPDCTLKRITKWLLFFRYSVYSILCVYMCVCLTYMIRIQPIGLVERIQAIAQNMSDMAVRVEQILQRSMASNRGMI